MKRIARTVVVTLALAGVALVVVVPSFLLRAEPHGETQPAAASLPVQAAAPTPAAEASPASKATMKPAVKKKAPKRRASRSRTRVLPKIDDPRTNPAAARALGFRWPTGGSVARVTSPYGPRGKGFHHGMDIGCGEGAPIYAAHAGRVVWAGEAQVYGYTVVVDHGNTYQTLYAHFSSIAVELGDSLKRGEMIGLCGSTGRSTGPHLHFEIRYNGFVWDPLAFLP